MILGEKDESKGFSLILILVLVIDSGTDGNFLSGNLSGTFLIASE